MLKNLIKALINNPVLANILMIFIIIGGIFAANRMIRETFPRISLDVITVSLKYPGADPTEIEESICLKLEEALEGISNVKEITTVSEEGIGAAYIECQDNADIAKIKDEVETQVNSITSFPEGTEKPVIVEETYRQEVLSIALWGKVPERQLKGYARQIEDELLDINGISQVTIQGLKDEELSIEVPEENLRKYKLTFSDIKKQINKNGLNLTVGTIKSNSEYITLKITGRRYEAKDYLNIPIKIKKDGTIIPLGKIATIRDTFNLDKKNLILHNGHPCILISIYKTETEDAINISESVDLYLKNKDLPPTLHLAKLFDSSRFVSGRLNILKTNGLIGLFLVAIVLWIFLDLRLSFWVAMGIPISVAGGLGIMGIFDCSLNMITMFGLIMILGLIVDDAIVIGESIYTRRLNGESETDSAVNGTAEVTMPVIAAVLTTIIAFLPLFCIRGVMGKFIGQLPIPVVAALIVSLIEGLFILPVHLRHLPEVVPLHKQKKTTLKAKIRIFITTYLDFFINKIYSRFITKALSFRYIIISISICIMFIVFGLYNGGIIKFIFFPKADEDYLMAKVELAPGTPLKYTKLVANHLLTSWKKVENKYRTNSNKKLTASQLSMMGITLGWKSLQKSNILEIRIELIPSEERNIHYKRLLTEWEDETGPIPGAISTRFRGTQHGPGGEPIEIRLLGENQKKLYEAATKIADKLNSIDGVFDTQIDYRPGNKEFELSIKPSAYHFGLTLDDIAQQIYTGFYGAKILQIQRGRDEVDVIIRFPEEDKNSVKYFKNMKITTSSGKRIPILMVTNISIKEGESIIKRKNRKRIMDITADIDNTKANAEEVINNLKADFLPIIKNKYNIKYIFEGQRKEKNNTIVDLAIGFPIALFAIYFIIASLFKSYIQPIIIMITIPFGLIGAILGHLILNLPITILSVFGMVALTGIVVNDAIVLIEAFNHRLEEGYTLFSALTNACKRRFRAILLTTLTTFSGLMPLILEKSLQAQFLIPMAVSIAFGVLFSTLVTLIIIPCIIAALNDIRRIIYFSIHFRYPSREMVEPRFNKKKSKTE
jgi:multidrug efflux pump subunit AcrB